MNKKLIFLVLLIVIILFSCFAYVEIYGIDVIDEEMQIECEEYLNETKVGEQRCCQIGWNVENLYKHPLEKCVILT